MIDDDDENGAPVQTKKKEKKEKYSLHFPKRTQCKRMHQMFTSSGTLEAYAQRNEHKLLRENNNDVINCLAGRCRCVSRVQ